MTADPTELLRRVGTALYGERWQSALARELGVSDRTVRRWTAGADTPKPGIYRELAAIVAKRQAELAELSGPLSAMRLDHDANERRVDWGSAPCVGTELVKPARSNH